jgi:hypothetical protein
MQAERQQERILLLGRITHDWNFLEHQIAHLTSLYTLDPEATYAMAARLRNAEATANLLVLVNERETRKRMVAAIEFAVSAFHRLRENRNVLVHSHHNFEITKKTVLWSRRSRSNPANIVTAYGNVSDLKRVAADIGRLRIYLSSLVDIGIYDQLEDAAAKDGQTKVWLSHWPKRPSLPKRFALPRKLEENQPSNQRRAQSPRKTSRR